MALNQYNEPPWEGVRSQKNSGMSDGADLGRSSRVLTAMGQSFRLADGWITGRELPRWPPWDSTQRTSK